MNDLQESLSQCTVKGNTVILPEQYLANYADVRKALLNAGASYKRNTFVFPNDAMPYLDRLMDNENVNIKKEFQVFFTPPELAKIIAQKANINAPGLLCLEPSAGQGALVKSILDIEPKSIVHAYELMEINKNVLSKLDCEILGSDFLTAPLEVRYDRILANPPFSKNQDITHTLKMWDWLAAGGRMVVINSKHWGTSLKKKEKDYRDWLEKVDANIETVEEGAFKSSGTMIETVILTIDKPLR